MDLVFDVVEGVEEEEERRDLGEREGCWREGGGTLMSGNLSGERERKEKEKEKERKRERKKEREEREIVNFKDR